MKINTVKIDAPGFPGGFMTINESDFDPDRHVLFGKEKQTAEKETGDFLTPPEQPAETPDEPKKPRARRKQHADIPSS